MSGLSTLNRFLGKKNKDKAAAKNGKFSKSSTNLSISTTNLNEPSQLEYNRITPLPVATSNAPFEQTFRITVLLPKDQLYVCRLGARIPLSKLLELVCENKQLDADKYEFRNPVDPSQVYNCELTIGAVGLSEIRLCHKSESYENNNFQTDEVIKLNRTNIIRDSLSSSEYSSRLNKSHANTKTPSPYSSSNSLNSMDSTGMNTRTPMITTATAAQNAKNHINNVNINGQNKIAPPPRKKRNAPRPPSQGVIPEKGPIETPAKEVLKTPETPTSVQEPKTQQILKKDYYVSTPNLTAVAQAHDDEVDSNANLNHSPMPRNGPSSFLLTEENNNEKPSKALYHGSVQDLSYNGKENIGNGNVVLKHPEPSPRKRLIQIKKKTTAPAPPPRNSLYRDTDDEDALSIASTNPSMSGLQPMTPDNSAATTPNVEEKPFVQQAKLQVQEPQANHRSPSPTPSKRSDVLVKEIPKPIPRQISTTTLLNATAIAVQSLELPPEETMRSSNSNGSNVSKVLLNRTPTPEPRSLSTEPPELDLRRRDEEEEADDDNISKQADSGIGEPIPSPIPDSLPSEGSTHETKSNFESSSDDDEMIKVYHFKLGKTVIPHAQHQTVEEPTPVNEVSGVSRTTTTTSIVKTETTSTSSSALSTEYFAIPISPPPHFADAMAQASESNARLVTKEADSPIQPKIVERPKLDFNALNSGDTIDRKSAVKKDLSPATPLLTPMTPVATTPASPLKDIVVELTALISDNKMDTLIKQPKEQQADIQAAKPNQLTNFSITSLGQQQQHQQHHQQQQQQMQITKEEEVLTTTTTTSTISNSSTLSASKSIAVFSFTEETLEASRAEEQPAPMESYGEEEPKKLSTLLQSSQNGHINQVKALQQKRKSLTRADSFQHTNAVSSLSFKQSSLDSSTHSLNARSASHMSLNKLDGSVMTNGSINSLQNGKRSSSELSIGETPSLQSVELIKTIMKTRKNSGSSNSSDSAAVVINDREEAIQKTIQMAEETLRVKALKEAPLPEAEPASELQITKEQPEPEDKSLVQAKEVPKTYRYSGPPSINFSTWNERPKFQVAIKNEGDYIFGGSTAAKQNSTSTTSGASVSLKANRMSLPVQSFKVEEKKVISPDSPVARMGIPEKEFKVPITVKPLKDVVCETPEPAVTSKPPKPPKTNVESNFATLPRNAGYNRFSTPMPPTTIPITPDATNPIPGQKSLRNTSFNKADLNGKPLTLAKENDKETNTEAPTPVPFGQGTLRKTGFKEKILAKDEKAAATTSPEVTTPSTAKQFFLNKTEQSSEQKSPTVVTATRISWRSSLNPTNDSKVTTTTNTNSTTATTTTTTTINNGFISQVTLKPTPAKAEVKPPKSNLELIIPKPKVFTNITVSNKIQVPKTAPPASTGASFSNEVGVGVGAAGGAGAVPPPPPPTFNLKPVKMVPKSAPASTGDPRDALLAAIRNFKREELKQA